MLNKQYIFQYIACCEQSMVSATAVSCHVRNAILICVRPVTSATKERSTIEEQLDKGQTQRE